MLRKTPFIETEFYHLYNRGNNKRSIFVDNRDRDRFVKLLYLCNRDRQIVYKEYESKPLHELVEEFKNDEPLVAIGAYCLMPNHFHIFVKEIMENGISTFMQKFATAYSMYFNKRNAHSGTLFEGRFKSSHVKNDNYLKYLFAYIHLNPIKLIDSHWKESGVEDLEGAKRFLDTYIYSSYLDYCSHDRPEKAILARGEFPEYFETVREFKDFIHDWLAFSDEEAGDEEDETSDVETPKELTPVAVI